jgi:acetylornithine deacetylase/succinyl-diaminopimelate desuccinylase-like protein
MEEFIEKQWHESVIPTLCEYIKVPNLSPFFDDKILENGLQEKAMEIFTNWIKGRGIKGMQMELIKLEGRTPLIFVDIKATNSDSKSVLLYAHMDKQPPFEGWGEGLGPYTPVVKDGKLYGRGGADDGYGMFCALTAIEGLQKAGIPHDRYTVIIEGSEESGSPDLPAYIAHLKDRLGEPTLVFCLDSGCGNYEQLWLTTSLRGYLAGDLTVQIIAEGVHSGDSSGVVPDSFRIIRALLSRLEDEETGKILIPSLFADISEQRQKQTKSVAHVLGMKGMVECFPFLPNVQHVDVKAQAGSDHVDVLTELAFNRWLRPQLTIIGGAGLPPTESAGNVLRPLTKLTLSLRLPPTVDTDEAAKEVEKVLTENPPLGAKVTWDYRKGGNGYLAPEVEPWLDDSCMSASHKYFNGKDALYMGEGGSIPYVSLFTVSCIYLMK